MNRYGRGFVLSAWLALVPILSPGAAQPSRTAQGESSSVPASLSATGAVVVEPVGQIGGLIKAVTIHGSYAYVGAGTDLMILNIADPAHPAPVGYADLPDTVTDVVVVGSYAYVAAGDVWIVEVSNPNRPRVLGHVLGKSNKIAAAGNYLYSTYFDPDTWESGLKILDVSDPQTPRELSRYQTWLPIKSVALAGNYVYVSVDRTYILDVNDPRNPREIGVVDPRPNSIHVVMGNYAYGVALWDTTPTMSMVIMDVSNPAAPRIISRLNMPGSPNGMAVVGNYAYVVGTGENDQGGILHIVDVSSPHNPRHVGSLNLPGEATDIAVSGPYAYVTDELNGLRTFDIRNPGSPLEISYFPIPGTVGRIATDGSYIYGIGSKLWIIDARNLRPPWLAGYYNLSPREVRDIAAANQRVYLLYEWGLLEIIDVSNPANPRLMFRSSLAAYGIDAVGNYLYVGTYNGLQIMDVSNPSSPRLIGSAPGSVDDVTVAGDYAYVTNGPQLRIIQIRDPANPRQIGVYEVPDATEVIVYPIIKGVGVQSNYVYIIYPGASASRDSIGRLRIIDVSHPEAPYSVGLYELPPGWNAVGIEVGGPYAYLLGAKCSLSSLSPDSSVLQILDVQNPTAPRLYRSYPIPACSVYIRKAADSIYIANLSDPMLALRIRELNRSVYLPMVLRHR